MAAFLGADALRAQFRTFNMIEPDGKIIENVKYMPSWAMGLFGGTFTGSEAGMHVAKNGLAIEGKGVVTGNQMVTHYRAGHNDFECVPTLVPLVVNGIDIKEDSVVFSEKGIGGAPDLIRMVTSDSTRRTETPMAGGGVAFEIEYPLYRKVVMGLDDTDSSVKGATFMTALQIAGMVENAVKGTKFLRLTISLNWPKNPVKTTNNASSAVVFAVPPDKEEAVISEFTRLATKATISKETGMTVMRKIQAPEPLKLYARKVKSVHVDVEEAFKAAKESGVEAIPITGERGLIGALSATGLVDHPEEAISPILVPNA